MTDYRVKSWSLVIALVLLTIAETTFPAGSGTSVDNPMWPLDKSTRFLTSNFMEYRAGRFHAGIDLKTNSETGYVVRAVEDGYISRVRATPFAYGRAIYLKGNSGKTFVYAHLSRFNDVLRRRVQRVQKENGVYRARVSFRREEIAVKKGDILGLSGESGTVGPHLHFEVRDKRGWPVNPLVHGFAVSDTLPPVIHSITAWPATPEARINGSRKEHALEAASGQGLVGDVPRLAINGPVAFSAKMIDAADIKGHRLEPWLIQVKLDGEVVYVCRNDTYGFEQNSLQRLEWADHACWDRPFREHWLHRGQANTLTGRVGNLWFLGQAGSGLEPGRHLLEIHAADLAGNSTSCRLELLVGAETKGLSNSWQAVDLGVAGDDGFRMNPFFRQGEATAWGAEVVSFSPSDGDPVLEALEVLIQPWPGLQILPIVEQGLIPLGPAAGFFAANWPIDSNLPVAFPGHHPVPDSLAALDQLHLDPRIGVYRQDKDGVWGLAGSLREPEVPGQLRFGLANPGLHALMRDEQAPMIDQRQLITIDSWQGDEITGVTMSRWSIFAVHLHDSESGIAPESILVRLNDRPLIVEPDLIRDRILIELPDELAPGKYELYVEAADEATNATSAYFEIFCRESDQ